MTTPMLRSVVEQLWPVANGDSTRKKNHQLNRWNTIRKLFADEFAVREAAPASLPAPALPPPALHRAMITTMNSVRKAHAA